MIHARIGIDSEEMIEISLITVMTAVSNFIPFLAIALLVREGWWLYRLMFSDS